jgi:hypothetical protein
MAAAHSMRMNLPRFGGRELVKPTYNTRGTVVKRGLLGHVQPVNIRKNMDKTSAYAGNIVLKKVNHPGSQANDFITRALALVEDEYQAMADQFGEAWAGDLAVMFKEAMPR